MFTEISATVVVEAIKEYFAPKRQAFSYTNLNHYRVHGLLLPSGENVKYGRAQYTVADTITLAVLLILKDTGIPMRYLRRPDRPLQTNIVDILVNRAERTDNCLAITEERVEQVYKMRDLLDVKTVRDEPIMIFDVAPVISRMIEIFNGLAAYEKYARTDKGPAHRLLREQVA